MFVGSIAGAGLFKKMLKLVAMNMVLHHVLKKSTYQGTDIYMFDSARTTDSGI